MADITKLLALFDAAFAVENAELCLFEEDVPGAEHAARVWAAARNLNVRISENDVDADFEFEVVRIDRNRFKTFISIHRAECRKAS